MNTDGTDFTTLHSFTERSGASPYINGDGASPYAALFLSGDTLYGTASGGGNSGQGTIFSVGTNGTGFMNLFNFAQAGSIHSSNIGGTESHAGLISSENTLYGPAYSGGSSGNGTLFRVSFEPQLTIAISEIDVVLTWPTKNAGFTYDGFVLQSTTNLVSPVVWTTNSLTPVVVNGQNTVTNPFTGTQKFFRLSQ